MLHLGEKTFTAEDQNVLATLSGDRNPAHMDSGFSRRSSTGKPDVHGVNLLLHAFEFLLHSDCEIIPRTFTCTFIRPVSVGDRAIFTQSNRSSDKLKLEISVKGITCCKVEIGLVESEQGRTAENPALALAEQVRPAAPMDNPPSDHVAKQYAVALGQVELGAEFPEVARRLPIPAVRAILASTYFVGMVCPGLHSIFSVLTIDMTSIDDGSPYALFTVDDFDDRFSLFKVSIGGAVAGTLGAFVRPRPVQQPDMPTIASHVVKGEFSGRVALIIGASRGLGELAFKTIAAGSGKVVGTFLGGQTDAQKITDEIAGGSDAAMVKFDVATQSIDDLAPHLGGVTSIYYFATPRIARDKKALFDNTLFEEFLDFYVRGFSEICDYFERNAHNKVTIFLPSSVFVEKRPRGLVEYAMAKSAAETLAVEMNSRYKKLRVQVVRLPQLNTDQNASVISSGLGSALDVMLPIIRSVEASSVMPAVANTDR